MKRRKLINYSLLFWAECTTSKLAETQHLKNSVQSETGPREEEPATLNMVLIPWQVSAEQEEKLKPLADYLTQKLQRPFKFQIAPDYKTAVDLLVEEKVELAYLSTSTYIEARLRDPNVEPLAAPINSETGRPWYTSVIVANTNRGIKSLADLKGKRFAFVSKLSTSGYILPMVHFQEIGIDPKYDFAEILVAGSHAQVKAMLIGEKSEKPLGLTQSQQDFRTINFLKKILTCI